MAQTKNKRLTMSADVIQIVIFLAITVLIGGLTYLRVTRDIAAQGAPGSAREEVFLAGKGLSWIVVALYHAHQPSTDQLVGMNSNQMAIGWWELAAVVGLIILAKLSCRLLPLQLHDHGRAPKKRYNDQRIRALIGLLFLLGNLFIFIPAMLYSGSLFIQTMFNVDLPLMLIAVAFAVVGSAYAVLGGLRAVAVSDAYSGVCCSR